MITASDPITGQTSSSPLTLCVTPYPPPQLYIPAEKQFIPDNPSLSSVFLVSNTSALYNSRPALRIPPKWSFSIGFKYDTFLAPNDVYYAARMTDGGQLPDWVAFNERELTFDGVTPPAANLSLPHIVQVALHASDQYGYTAGSIPFDIVVASHDFALTTPTNTLPTINVTTDQPFQLTLNSAADFSGVTLDGLPIVPNNITTLGIDTSGLESWLHYEQQTKTLTGTPPQEFSTGVLPVVMRSNVNQTLHTKVTLAAVPSFFSAAELDPILATQGNNVSFDLAWHFSNASGLGRNSDIELSAAYSPTEAGYFLTFDSGTDKLTGTVPENTTYSHVDITFTAYSHITHSTSHASLPLSLTSSDFDQQKKRDGGGVLSNAAREKLLLALKIAFGVICGFVNLAILFAMFRRCARVEDSAIVGEEARKAWTADELKWYGIGIEVNGEKYEPASADVDSGSGREYGTSEGALAGSASGIVPSLSRILSRTFSVSNHRGSPFSPVGLPQSPPVIKKVEFLGRVRQTARIVSDKYRRVLSGPRRPVVGKPTLILTGEDATRIPPIRTAIDGLPFTNPDGLLPMVGRLSQHDLRPFEDTTLIRYAPSGLTSPTDSPSSSTDGRSIPRRRADFAPPKKPVAVPAQAHIPMDMDTGDGREHRSVDSFASSLATNSSSRTHEAEAVIQRATRALSLRSGTSAISNVVVVDDVHGHGHGQRARPRLVPFTSAARVPVPKLPSSSFFAPEAASPNPAGGVLGPAHAHAHGRTRRVASQMAKVFRNAAVVQVDPPDATTATAVDELLDAVGAQPDGELEVTGERSLVVSSSSIDSPQLPADKSKKAPGGRPPPVPRMLARTGERFRFRVPVAAAPGRRGAGAGSKGGLEARLVSGKPLPRFIKVDMDAVPSGAGAQLQKRVVELSGVPVSPNIGVYEIGVYEQGAGGACVGKVVVEVVLKKPA
ncbi:hypothetical protein GSI_08433 [Ganoderma sinense ZZ0214-1]|uniref:Dystroglycan-type cadherin-like domain-containing protein n=1 Tax=Ganoderma sinense ZZ0214-1 TaxID=1077348 RepID=A0A2G8S6V7_9APHY|nr:hypothetical protein GSI_08433 [Ganoderma sinense ZZ0214-1]